MVKLLGSLCIFAAGTWAWYQQRLQCRREVDALADLTAALLRMAEEIRMSRTALPVLLDRIQIGRTPTVAAFFRETATAARQGEGAAAGWRRAAENLLLTAEDQASLQEVAGALSGDEATVCKALTLAAAQLGHSLEETRRRRPEQEKRAAALWFSGAALLVILLI